MPIESKKGFAMPNRNPSTQNYDNMGGSEKQFFIKKFEKLSPIQKDILFCLLLLNTPVPSEMIAEILSLENNLVKKIFQEMRMKSELVEGEECFILIPEVVKFLNENISKDKSKSLNGKIVNYLEKIIE